MTFLVVLAIVFSVEGWNFGELKNAISQSGKRSKRASNCNGAYRETQNPRYEQCLEYLSDDQLTNQQLDTFCHENCILILGRVFHDIYIYCHDEVSLDTMLEYFNSHIATTIQ